MNGPGQGNESKLWQPEFLAQRLYSKKRRRKGDRQRADCKTGLKHNLDRSTIATNRNNLKFPERPER
jgi:hypothetical protein